LTGRVEGHNNLLAYLELRHGIALFYYGTDEFVSGDKIARALQVAAVEVQVGALVVRGVLVHMNRTETIGGIWNSRIEQLMSL
jgi:hypothetical protein